jgi:Zn-dependent peptidase ImmA (M78 family)
MHERGYIINFVPKDKLPESCSGVCNIKNKNINIKSGMSDLETVSTVIHECAHALAHTDKRQDFEGLTIKDVRQIEEVEAESIALVVASKFGLDTENFNLSYIAGWSDADISKFRKNVDVIRANSTKLIEAIEQGFEANRKKEKEIENAAASKDENAADSKKKPAKANRLNKSAEEMAI